MDEAGAEAAMGSRSEYSSTSTLQLLEFLGFKKGCVCAIILVAQLKIMFVKICAVL